MQIPSSCLVFRLVCDDAESEQIVGFCLESNGFPFVDQFCRDLRTCLVAGKAKIKCEKDSIVFNLPLEGHQCHFGGLPHNVIEVIGKLLEDDSKKNNLEVGPLATAKNETCLVMLKGVRCIRRIDPKVFNQD